MIRHFLEATLGDDDDAARALAALEPPADDPFFTVSRERAVGPVPTEEELYRLAETDPEAAEAAYREATRIVPGSALFREHEASTSAAADAAIRIARLNVAPPAPPRTTAPSWPPPPRA